MSRSPRAGARLALLALHLAFVAWGCGPSLERPSRVVLVTLDTTRADRLGCYGYPGARTPNMDSLAAEGTLFLHAVAPVPVTLPSHSSMLTGLYPPATGVRYNTSFRLDDKHVTLAEKLRDAGYDTAAFLAAFPLASTFGLNQGFDIYDAPDDLLNRAREGEPTERTAEQVIDKVLAWLGNRESDRRFFLWVHLWDPHWPYEPPFPYSHEFRDRPYDGEIAYTDHQLGRLLAALRGNADWPTTLVLIAGDHGEGLYDHGEKFHSYLTYETTLRVPLIAKVPGSRAGQVIDEPVSLVDLFPTTLDLCGVAFEDLTVHGSSLRPAFEGGSPPRRDLYFEAMAGNLVCGWDPVEGVRWGNWKLTRYTELELFDLAEDPGELVNLVGREPRQAADLERALEELVAPLTAVEPTGAARAPGLEPDVQAALASLGYVSGASTTVDRTARRDRDPRALVYLEGEITTLQWTLSQENWDSALEGADYVLGRDPTNRFALYVRALSLTKLERVAEALEGANVLLEHYPDAPELYDLNGQIHVALGRPAEAVQVFREGRARFPDSDTLTYHEVLALFEAGRTTEACREVLPASLERFPASGLLLVQRARCGLRQGSPDRAIEDLRLAVEKGFRDLEKLAELEDFRPLSRDERFRELVETVRAPREPAG